MPERNLPDFLSAVEWPSPELNPLDFSIWEYIYMLSKTGSTKGMNFESFKHRLSQIWKEMAREVIRGARDSYHFLFDYGQ